MDANTFHGRRYIWAPLQLTLVTFEHRYIRVPCHGSLLTFGHRYISAPLHRGPVTLRCGHISSPLHSGAVTFRCRCIWPLLHLGPVTFRRCHISVPKTRRAPGNDHRRHKGRLETSTDDTKGARKRPQTAQRASGGDHRRHKGRPAPALRRGFRENRALLA